MGIISLLSPTVLQGSFGNLITALFRPERAIGEFRAQVTIEEVGVDELEITNHPVAYGAAITDHSYKKPSEVVIRCAFSNSSLASVITDIAGAQQFVTQGSVGSLNYAKQVYEQLLIMQQQRIPFTVITGKRTYNYMLAKSVTQHTDKETENILAVTIRCQQVIIANISTISVQNTNGTTPTPIDGTTTNPVLTNGTQALFTGSLTPGSAFDAVEAAQNIGNLININTGGLGN